MVLVAEISGTSLIFLAVVIVLILAVAYGLFTRQGSGINKHPRSDSQDPKTELERDEDEDLDERAGVDSTEGGADGMDQHGTV